MCLFAPIFSITVPEYLLPPIQHAFIGWDKLFLLSSVTISTFLRYLDELFKDMLFLLHGLLEERFEILVYGEGDKGNGTRNCEMV